MRQNEDEGNRIEVVKKQMKRKTSCGCTKAITEKERRIFLSKRLIYVDLDILSSE